MKNLLIIAGIVAIIILIIRHNRPAPVTLRTPPPVGSGPVPQTIIDNSNNSGFGPTSHPLY